MERTYIYISLTFTRSSDTELPGSRPLAMCAISCTRPPFERISHCMKTSQKLASIIHNFLFFEGRNLAD